MGRAHRVVIFHSAPFSSPLTATLKHEDTELELKPAIVTGPDDVSEQFNILLSTGAIAWLTRLSAAPLALSESMRWARVEALQAAVRLFCQTHITRPATPTELEERLAHQSALVDRLRLHLTDEIDIRKEI